MNLKKTSLSIIAIVINGLLFTQGVSAGLVPGTIQKGQAVSSIQQCKEENGITYKTGYSCVNTSQCKDYKIAENSVCGCAESTTSCNKTNECLDWNYQTNCEVYGEWSEGCAKAPNALVKTSCKTFGTTLPCKIWNYQTNCEVYGEWSEGCVKAPNALVKTSCQVYGETTEIQCTEWAPKICIKNKSCSNIVNGCEIYKDQPSFSTSTYYDYNYNASNYTFGGLYNPGSNRILGNDSGKTCFISADGSNKTKPTTLKTTTCDINNSTYYSTAGASGKCYIYAGKNTYLDTFDQLGDTKFRDNIATTGDNTCIIEGRYAQVDDTKPTVNITYGSFNTNTNQWCNLDKYKQTGQFSGKGVYGSGSLTNVSTPGCDDYEIDENMTDLVDKFTITVQDGQSGLSSVKVEIGSCGGTYDFDGDLSDIINDTNTPGGVRGGFKTTMIISSSEVSTYAGRAIVSLKTLFGKTRLDECLVEGENYIKVTAKDAARSNTDGTTLSPNEIIVLDISKAIRIDNSGPTFTALSPGFNSDPTYQIQTDPYAAGVNSKESWYNKNISGTFQISDMVNSGEILCTNYTIVPDGGQCDNSLLPNGATWNTPVKSDGKYDISQCEGIDITNANVCQYSTAPTDPYSWDTGGTYTGCDGSKEFKTVTCSNSGGDLDTSRCTESDLTSTFAGDEEILDRDPGFISYTLQRSCTLPVGCFTIGSSTIGGTDSLCSN